MGAITFTFKTQRAKRTFAAVDINVCYADKPVVYLLITKTLFARFAIEAKHTRLNIRLSRLCLRIINESCEAVLKAESVRQNEAFTPQFNCSG